MSKAAKMNETNANINEAVKSPSALYAANFVAALMKIYRFRAPLMFTLVTSQQEERPIRIAYYGGLGEK